MSLPARARTQLHTLPEEDALEIAMEAYIYAYPLVLMELTRRVFTNVAQPDANGHAPTNRFGHKQAFPDPSFTEVVRPNADTLYSMLWFDVSKEPLMIHVPDSGDRYYLLQAMDMWTDVFASPGWRTTGTHVGNFLVTPRGWSGTVPAGFTQIEAPTPYVWIIGRTKTDGPSDYDAVHKIQAGYKVTPLTEWGKSPKPVEVKIASSVDMKTPPKTQMDTMQADQFFVYAAELLKLHPPHLTDQPIIAQLMRIGFERGKSFDITKVDPVVKKALEDAPAAGQKLMEWKLPTLARVVNYWSLNTDTVGVYGNYYLKRAIVAQFGLGANLPEDAIYPINLADETGKPLDGASKYTIHFDKGATPPVNAFWSLTLYDSDGFQVANSLNRFAVSSWMPFKYNPDGSLDIYFQNESPGKDREANWLPAPKAAFNLTMRLYGPKSEVLTGKWNPPPVTKVQRLPSVTAQ